MDLFLYDSSLETESFYGRFIDNSVSKISANDQFTIYINNLSSDDELSITSYMSRTHPTVEYTILSI